MSAKIRFSRFLRIKEDGGVVAVFHQLNINPVFLNASEWKRQSRNLECNAILNELSQRNLVATEATDAAVVEQFRQAYLGRLNRTSILYLLLAQGCNYNCTYCPIPESARRYGEGLLSYTDACAGFDLWLEHLKGEDDGKPYYVIFYGGEPLLNRDTLERLVPVVRSRCANLGLPKSLELVLPTNGKLIDERLAAFLAEHDIQVALGVDGSPEFNDLTRLSLTEEKTSSTFENTVRLLRKYGVRLSASVTLTPQNVHAADDHKSYLRSRGITRLGFNLIKGKALLASLGSMSFEEYYRAVAKAVVSGFGDEQTQEFQLQKKLDAVLSGRAFGDDCPCYGSQIVVQPDGMVSNCPFYRVDAGHVQSLPKSFRIWSAPAVQIWRSRIPWLRNDLSSEDTFLTGGGCVWSSNELSGSPSARDRGNEIFTTEVMNVLLWKLLPEQVRQRLLAGNLTHWCYRRDRAL